MLIECGVKVSGHYRIELIDTITNTIKQVFELNNIITDNGLVSIAGGVTISNLFAYLRVGRGTRTPAVTDTALETPAGTASNTTDGADETGTNNSPAYSYWRRTLVCAEGNATGAISELGFQSAGNVLGSRVLVTDSTGNTAVINKTASDKMRVQFELRVYAATGDITGAQNMSGSVVNYTIRPQGVGLSNWVASIPSFGSWTSAFAYAHETQVITPYTTVNNPSPKVLASTTTLETAGANYRDITFKWSASSTGNNIGLITVSPWVAGDGNQMWQIYFNPKIPKTTLNRLSITFRQYFGRK